jgi:hypothetical protein
MDATTEPPGLERAAAVGSVPAVESVMAVDPVTASIIRHGLDAAADQMLVTLKRKLVYRHLGSPNLRASSSATTTACSVGAAK